jgi:hypothetical protein
MDYLYIHVKALEAGIYLVWGPCMIIMPLSCGALIPPIKPTSLSFIFANFVHHLKN